MVASAAIVPTTATAAPATSESSRLFTAASRTAGSHNLFEPAQREPAEGKPECRRAVERVQRHDDQWREEKHEDERRVEAQAVRGPAGACEAVEDVHESFRGGRAGEALERLELAEREVDQEEHGHEQECQRCRSLAVAVQDLELVGDEVAEEHDAAADLIGRDEIAGGEYENEHERANRAGHRQGRRTRVKLRIAPAPRSRAFSSSSGRIFIIAAVRMRIVSGRKTDSQVIRTADRL